MRKDVQMTKYRYVVVDAMIDGKMRYAIHHVKTDEHGDTVIHFSRWFEKLEDAEALIALKENTGGVFG